MHLARGLLGIATLLLIAWLLSSQRRRFPVKVVVGGLVLQFGLALVVLKTPYGQAVFDAIGKLVNLVLIAADEGAAFVFGPITAMPAVVVGVKIMATIVVCSTLSAIGYHYGILQRVVAGLAYVMSRVLGVSGAESLSCAANVFLGQTEAPLLVRPYIPQMTRSELMAIMTGGFATIAMGVMAVYVDFLGIDASGAASAERKIAVARHLLTASLLSAPAAFVMAKVMVPETEQPQTARLAAARVEIETRNGLDAATQGASQGMLLAINVLAMLIAFTALIKLLNLALGWLSQPLPPGDAAAPALWSIDPPLSIQSILGWLFSPVAFFIGIEAADRQAFGSLLGTAMAANEFVAYLSLAEMIKSGAIAERSVVLATYSLCGFANLASMGIQIAGIGSIAPTRRRDLVQLAPRAMFGGAMASWMTGTVAGMLL